MNILDVNSPVFSLAPETQRRLIVLVADSKTDVSSAAQKISGLATALNSRVQFLGLCKDQAQEPSLKRQIIAISAIMNGDGIVDVESKIESGGNWLDFVKSNWNTGDAILCFGEQRTGLAHRPLGRILESNLNATVYVIPEIQIEYPRRGWVSSLMGWAGSISLVLGFFWLQMKLIQSPNDAIYTTLLYLSIFIEAVSIWGWNNLFG